jgi:hypothetical protein
MKSFQRLGAETARRVLDFYHLRSQPDADVADVAAAAS